MALHHHQRYDCRQLSVTGAQRSKAILRKTGGDHFNDTIEPESIRCDPNALIGAPPCTAVCPNGFYAMPETTPKCHKSYIAHDSPSMF
jgi:hypothetical protein